MTVRIAGAGLAGLVAATTAARAGEDVEVYEIKRTLLPSTGAHTEALRNYESVDAVEELRSYGFKIRPFAEVSSAIRRSEHHKNVLRGKSYYLFMRGREEYTVDQQLYHEALDLGVRFRFGAKAPSHVDITATGPPRRAFNMLAAGFTFTLEGSNLDPHTVIALLDNRVAPGGYLAITPGIEYHSIYSGSWTDLDYERVLALAKRAFEIPWVRDILGTSRWVDKIHGTAYYERDPIASAVHDESLRVGEAGGFQDAVAAYGFRYAVITGALAAQSVVERSDYTSLLRSRFKDDFENAFAYRQKLDKASNRDYDELVRSLGLELTIEQYRGLRAKLRAL
ncbi:MAG TPA: NAD(P)-binding protein [Thermoplasmata archaeon]|nr:NAD(P)-binding protein [Thermoplasmata archaeon]